MRHMKAPLRVTVDDGETPLQRAAARLPEIDWRHRRRRHRGHRPPQGRAQRGRSWPTTT